MVKGFEIDEKKISAANNEEDKKGAEPREDTDKENYCESTGGDGVGPNG